MPVGNNNAPVRASSVNYSQSIAYVRVVERGQSSDGSESARNWLDGIYGETTTAIKYPTFQGTTYSMNYHSQSDAFNIAKVMTENGNIYGLTENTDSHLMKNSEWGACVYLSQSQYGLNGTDIAINNINLNSGGLKRTNTGGKSGVDSVYTVTGCTGGTNSEAEKVTTINQMNTTVGNTPNDGVYTWDQLTGCRASTTGTIYGIYDFSGGSFERIAAYIANGQKVLNTYGNSFTYDGTTLKTISTKYVMVYPFDNTKDNISITINDANLDIASKNNYQKNTLIYGDGIRETSVSGTASTSWYNDFSYYPSLNAPFPLRGGNFSNALDAGLFYFTRRNGGSGYFDGFHAVLVVS